MAFGIDCVTLPSIATLQSNGVKFVCRYVSTVGNPKNITHSEVKALRAAGINIVIVFETTANRAMRGQTAGMSDALSARSQVRAVGGPTDAVIYFAVDFDASAVDQTTINKYLAGAASVLSKGRVGVYGGYWVVKRALDAKVCKYAWQTYAWSGGQWDNRAQLRQTANGQYLHGTQVDFDNSVAMDYGQWWYKGAAVPPLPVGIGGAPQTGALPGPAKKPAWFWLALKKFLDNRKKPRP